MDSTIKAVCEELDETVGLIDSDPEAAKEKIWKIYTFIKDFEVIDWVPIEEELPEKAEKVLTTSFYSKANLVSVGEYYHAGKGKFVDAIEEYYEPPGEVTAWAYLPEGYRKP